MISLMSFLIFSTFSVTTLFTFLGKSIGAFFLRRGLGTGLGGSKGVGSNGLGKISVCNCLFTSYWSV